MRRISGLRSALLTLAVAGLLAGCGGNQVASYYRPYNTYHAHHHKASLPSGHGGYHKTGSPYTVAGRTYYPLASAAGYDRTGIASWYGRDFHGKLTADGESYDMHALSAAHKTLPLPTLVRVTDLENGRSVVVRVNDRGPFVKNRLIDLSYAAAKALGFADQGTARVRVQALDSGGTAYAANTPPRPSIASSLTPPAATPPVAPPAPTPSLASPSARPAAASGRVTNAKPTPGMYIQLGAFSEMSNADRLRSSLSGEYPSVSVQPVMRNLRRMYRVRIGPYSDVRNIERTVMSLEKQGYSDAIVVIE